MPFGHRTPDSTSVISSLNLYLGHCAVPFLRDFPQNRCMNFSTFLACHISHPSYSTRPHHSYPYYVKSTFPYYGNLSIILLFPSFLVQILSESPCSRTSSVYVVLQKPETNFPTSIKKTRQNYELIKIKFH